MTPNTSDPRPERPHDPDERDPESQDPDELSPLLCYCRRVREATIRSAIAEGHTELEELIEETGAATGCGTCRFELAAFLADEVANGRTDPESGGASRHLLLALGFVALFLTTFVIAWNLDLGMTSRTPSRQDGPGPKREAASPVTAERFTSPPTDPAAGEPEARNLQVVDVFGQPLPDARIEWLRQGQSPEPVRLDTNATAARPYSTDDTTFLIIRHPEFSPAVVPSSAHGPEQVVLTSRPGLRVRIVDATTERGVPRAQVRWRPQQVDSRLGSELALMESGSLEWRAESGVDGYAVLRGLPDCAGRLRVESLGHRTVEVDLESADHGNDEPPIVRLSPGRSLRAILVDSNGDPLPYWWVYATPRDGGATCSASATQDGALRLRGLANGPFDAVAGGHVSAPLTQRFDDTRRVLVLQLPPPKILRGAIVDSGGLRLANARLDELGRGFWGRRSFEAGVFEIEAYPVGPLWLRAEAPGHVSQALEIHPETRNPIEFRLGIAPTILGRIIDAKGDPVVGARVELVHADGTQPTRRIARKYQTSRNASFAIDFDLESGRGRLRVETHDRPTIFTDIVERGDDNTPIDLGSIRIPPPATVTLDLGDTKHDPGLPELRPVEAGSLPTVPLRKRADGSFDSGLVAPGDYVLVLIPPPLSDRFPSVHAVRLVPGRHTELRLVHDDEADADRIEEAPVRNAEDNR
ncbi:MAG: (2Fe-2S)-binding protein [Planctomycetota bacterium]